MLHLWAGRKEVTKFSRFPYEFYYITSFREDQGKSEIYDFLIGEESIFRDSRNKFIYQVTSSKTLENEPSSKDLKYLIEIVETPTYETLKFTNYHMFHLNDKFISSAVRYNFITEISKTAIESWLSNDFVREIILYAELIKQNNPRDFKGVVNVQYIFGEAIYNFVRPFIDRALMRREFKIREYKFNSLYSLLYLTEYSETKAKKDLLKIIFGGMTFSEFRELLLEKAREEIEYHLLSGF